jgi:DegV family protein with EDD domain
MAVKVVTDTAADIPLDILEKWGIQTVPVLVQYEKKTFRDGIDINADEIYRLLVEGKVKLTTSAPFLNDLVEVYQRLSQESSDGIISIHISDKLSATCKTALLAKDKVNEEKECRIEVIDSQAVVMATGFLPILAAKMAKEGKGLEEIVKAVKSAIPKIHLLGCLDTLKYLKEGGRIGKASALLGGLLKTKPLLTMEDGEFSPSGRVQGITKAKERLLDFVKSFSEPEKEVRGVAMEYTTDKDREVAEDLLGKMKSLFPKATPIPKATPTFYLSRISPVLGVHAGPGTLIVSLMEG